MDLRIKVVLAAVSLLMASCVFTEEGYPAESFYISVGDAVDLQVVAGTFESVEYSQDRHIYKVDFESVRGGKSLLFGKIKLREVNGYNSNRLELSREGKVHMEYSVEALMSLNTIMVDSIRVIDLTGD